MLFSSHYITDVIISTDSEHVRIIGEQMGAKVKWQTVHFAVMPLLLMQLLLMQYLKVNGDYIITIAPTSPTLRVETLDAAIKYATDNDLDHTDIRYKCSSFILGEKDGKST